MPTPADDTLILLLEAAAESVKHQMECAEVIGRLRGVDSRELFYEWSLPSRQKQRKAAGMDVGFSGTFGSDTETWSYYFHGQECDIRNLKDDRRVRIEFRRGGRVDTVSGYSLFVFLLNTRSPWQEFQALRETLRTPGEQFDSVEVERRIIELMNRYSELGWFEMPKNRESLGPDEDVPPSMDDDNWWRAFFDRDFPPRGGIAPAGYELLARLMGSSTFELTIDWEWVNSMSAVLVPDE